MSGGLKHAVAILGGNHVPPHVIRIEFRGNGFLRHVGIEKTVYSSDISTTYFTIQMVRRLAAALISVGRHETHPTWIKSQLLPPKNAEQSSSCKLFTSLPRPAFPGRIETITIILEKVAMIREGTTPSRLVLWYTFGSIKTDLTNSVQTITRKKERVCRLGSVHRKIFASLCVGSLPTAHRNIRQQKKNSLNALSTACGLWLEKVIYDYGIDPSIDGRQGSSRQNGCCKFQIFCCECPSGLPTDK